MIRSVLFALALSSSSLFGASKMHVLFAMDTHAENIGEHIKKDSANLIDVFGDIRDGREQKIDWNKYSEDQLTPAALRGFYRGRNWDPDTTLVFIYSGHGGLDSGGQFLAMRYGAIYREEIRRLMEETGTIAQVIISDSCANRVSDGLVEGIPKRPVRAEWAMFEQLFFQVEGLVDVNATKEGFFSFTNQDTGGLFLYTLARLLCQPIASVDSNQDGRITWNEFGGNLVAQTKDLYRIFRDNSGPNSIFQQQETQEPHFYYVAGNRRDEEMKAVINRDLTQIYAAEADAVQKYAAFVSSIGRANTSTYANFLASRYDGFGTHYDGLARLYENVSKNSIVPLSKRNSARNGNGEFATKAQAIIIQKMTSLLQSRNSQYQIARGYRTLAARLP